MVRTYSECNLHDGRMSGQLAWLRWNKKGNDSTDEMMKVRKGSKSWNVQKKEKRKKCGTSPVAAEVVVLNGIDEKDDERDDAWRGWRRNQCRKS